MKQSKLVSLVEANINMITGIIIALLTWQFIIIPVWEVNTTFLDNIWITLLFTIISVIRSYVWRRIFNVKAQTKIMSFIEQCANMGSGFIISLMVFSFIVIPLWGIDNTSAIDNILIVGLFPLISIIRGYLWRRFFNKGLHKVVMDSIRRT